MRSPNNQWYRLITPVFLHAGVIHLIFNILFHAQCFFFERRVKWWRVCIGYLLSGIAGYMLSCVFLPIRISVGASSALFGVAGMMLVHAFRNYRDYKKPIWNIAALIFTTLVSLVIGLLPFVDNFAQIGGLAIGILLGIILIPDFYSPDYIGDFGVGCTIRQFTHSFVKMIALILVVILYCMTFWAIYNEVPLNDWCTFCNDINCVELPGYNWCNQYSSLT